MNANTNYKVDPLNGDNYIAWRRRLEWILDDQDLWGITIGLEKKPTPADATKVKPEEDLAIAEWTRKEKKARKEICLRISDEYLVYIDQTMTAPDVWIKLQGIFESKASVGLTHIRREFFRTMAEDGTNMEEHIRKLHGLHQQLKARGQDITDTEFTNTLLTSLPASWASFITTINASGIAITSETLIGRILDEDRSRHAGSGRQTALKVQNSRTKTEQSGATKGKCRNCGKKGHYVKDCWAKGGGKEGQAPKWFKEPKDKESAKQSEDAEFAFMANDIAFAAISASDWLADSAATTHIARNRNDFISYSDEPSEIEGITPGASLKTRGRGTVAIDFKVNDKVYSVKLNDVKHAPESPNNIISIGRLTDHGHSANFTATGVEFRLKTGVIFAMGRKIGRMYQMRTRTKGTSQKQDFVAAVKGRTLDKWHRVLGHVNTWTINMLQKNNLVTGLIVDKSQAPTQCTACIQGKQHVEPFPKQTDEKVQAIGDLTLSDVWGPAQIEGPGRERYFYTYTDFKTRYSVLYFGHTKDEALQHFQSYKQFVETQTGNKLKRFRSDNGGEYVNKSFKEFCATNGIIMETTAPYSPAQNGIAERLNRTLLEHARAMIFAKNLPKTLWPEAVTYANYIKNKCLTRALGTDITPYQAFFGKKPNVSRLEEFGTKCWVLVPDQRRAKLDPKAEEHIFVGVAEHAKAWKYYNTISRHVQTSRNITFDEQDTKLYPIPSEDDNEVMLEGENPAHEQAPEPAKDPAPSTPQTSIVPAPAITEPETRRSTRVITRPDYRLLNNPNAKGGTGDKALISHEIITEPANYAEAIARDDAPIWIESMSIEIAQHEEIGTWDLVDLPPDRTAIGSRWVYAVKTKPTGQFEKAKSRIVAQGFTQRPGMDYYDITSPVVKFDSLRLLLALGNALDWEIELMDVKGAYLNSDLEEEIYMRQPEGFDDGSGRVLKLRRALYGLKQAGRAWHQQLRSTLLSFGYTQSTADECIYIRINGSHIEIISVYVDDLGLFANSKDGMARIKEELNGKFTMTDLGEMEKILGLRVERNREDGTLKISQGPYIDVLLARFHMQDANPVSTPLSKSVKLVIPTELASAPTIDAPYAKAIGSLMYAALGTRPDLAFAVQHLSQFTTSYGAEHWTALKHVLRYLKGTRDYGIIFQREAGLNLEAFVDSDYANREDARSVGGYVVKLGNGSIAWSSKKQRTVALSTTEAEYIALTEGAKQVIWLRRFLQDLNFEQSQPTSMRSDNLGAITLSHDATYHARTKHINVAYHFIREKVTSNEVALTYVRSKENPADLMTKGLEMNQHRYLRGKLGFGTVSELRGSVE